MSENTKSVNLVFILVILMLNVNLFGSKVVAILPFTSVFEKIAQEQKDAINLALGNYDNEIEIIYKDSKGTAEGAITALDEFIKSNGNPEIVISCASWVATALNPVTAERGLFHLAIGSASIEREIKNHTIRMTVDEQVEEELLSYYLLQFNKIAVFYMNNELGTTWNRVLRKRLREKINISISYDPEMKDFDNEISQIKKAEPEAIVLISSSNAAKISELIRKAGINAQLVGTRPIERPEILTASKYTNGLIFTSPSFDSENEMLKLFKEKYNYKPTFFGLEAYDTTVMLITAFKENSSVKDFYNWYIDRNFIGALGSIKIKQNGDANYPYMFKEVKDGKFTIAEFQYALILEQTRQEIDSIFDKMGFDLQQAANELSSGITGKKADMTIRRLHEKNPLSYDVVTIDPKGVIRNVYPDHKEIVNKDISDQEQVIRMMELNKPVVSKAFKAVEGFVGFDYEYPIFNEKNEYIGAVSILTKPSFFAEIINSKIASFPVEICVMQTDGVIVYDINEEEIGLNLFSSESYDNYPTLRQLGRKMSIFPQGSGDYEYLDKNMDKVVEKELIWTNLHVHGTEFRIALFTEKKD
ncbi:MAG: ABC transporter substrate-binding protein [Candidatus Cloacimonetes bacterium]|nr:ABC transporter substrate-binding protein [Candidatus Cloacimonadota bacterium]